MSRPSIDPRRWQPPTATARAGQRRGPVPVPPLRVLDVLGSGPEDVLVAPDGAVLTGVADGRIQRLRPDGSAVEVVADTGGRPLGLEWLPDGALLVCDARRGLLRVGDDGTDVLVSEVDGVPLRFCNNAAVAADGTVYFTDSSRRFGIDHWKADLLEHSATGRLLRRGLGAEVSVLLDDLAFANGVALSPDGASVVVAESAAYRLTRLDVDTGAADVLVDNLPGFPDNISTGSDGLIWIAIASPRDRLLDQASRLHPALRKGIWALPAQLRPKEKRTVWVRAINGETGKVVHEYFDSPENFHMVTGVREHNGTVYLGSLEERAIATFPVR
jgi:sugar lactone lactonase YvrE